MHYSEMSFQKQLKEPSMSIFLRTSFTLLLLLLWSMAAHGGLVFEADYTGSGNSLVTTGGTATGPIQPTGSWVGLTNVWSKSCMGQTSYLDLNFSQTATSGGYSPVTFTPTNSSTSLASITTGTTGGYLLLNGAIDFFYRPVIVPTATTGNWFRPLDVNNQSNGGLRIIVVNNPASNSQLQLQLYASPSTAFTASGTQTNATVSGNSVSLTSISSNFSLTSPGVSHICIGFSTNSSTGVVTFSLYGLNDAGAINTASGSSELLAQAQFKINSTVVTAGLSSAEFPFPFLYPMSSAVAEQIDYDAFRIYSGSVPSYLPGLATPVILHSSETAGPGDVINLLGSNFGVNTQVWMTHVNGNGTLSPTTQLTIVNGAASSVNSCVNAQIPTTETTGLYAIWVCDGSTFSNPIFINQARAWGAVDLGGLSVDPGRPFHLFGRNLLEPGVTPTVSFINGSTTLAATVTTSGSTANYLAVQAPSGLLANTVYTVQVNNGLGASTYGNSTSANNFTLTGQAAGVDSFGLGVPWGCDFAGVATTTINVTQSPYNADKTGATNCQAAIQNAINAAAALPNGGVVYFPTGTYWVNMANQTTGLTMKSNVVLKGDGPTLSEIKFSGTTVATSRYSIYSGTVNKIGITGLNISNDGTGGFYTLRFYFGSSEIFLINSLVQGYDQVIDCQQSRRIIVNNCTLNDLATGYDAAGQAGDSAAFCQDTDLIVENSTLFHHISLWYFRQSLRVLVQNNLDQRDTLEDTAYTNLNPPGGQTREFVITADQQAAVRDNTFKKVVSTGPPQFYDDDDCETITEENNIVDDGAANNTATCDTGQISSATANTLTDTTKNWATTGANTYGQGVPTVSLPYSVAIIGGPGAGQLRTVTANTANTLTVDHNWDVQPNAQSVYAVRLIVRHLLIDGNTLTGMAKGFSIYGASEQDDTIINNTLTDSGGIYLYLSFRPFQEGAGNSRFDVQFDQQITKNTVTDTLGLYPAFIGTTRNSVESGAPSGSPYYGLAPNGVYDIGTVAFGMEFRGNSVTGNTSYAIYPEGQWPLGEGFYCFPEGNGSWNPGYPLDQEEGPMYPASAPSYIGPAIVYQGVIFQHNTATSISAISEGPDGNIYQVGTGAYQIGTGDSSLVIYDATYNNLPAGTDQVNDLIGSYQDDGNPPGGASSASLNTAVNNSIISVTSQESPAQTISLQYQTNGSPVVNSSAGYLTETHWNAPNIPYVGQGTYTVSNLVDSTGVSTAISESTYCCGGYDHPAGGGFTTGSGDYDLFAGFALGNYGGVGDVTMTLSGLNTAKTYTLIAYVTASDTNNTVLSGSVNISGIPTYYLKASALGTYAPGFATSQGTAVNGNYFEFANITGKSSVTFTVHNYGNSSILTCLNGFQLISSP